MILVIGLGSFLPDCLNILYVNRRIDWNSFLPFTCYRFQYFSYTGKLILQFSLQTRPYNPIRVEYLSYKLIKQVYDNIVEPDLVEW